MEGPELPPEGERNKFFPRVAPPPAPQTFEVGLILGGTVSAGAYTAGALDLFFQVLDRWYQQSSPLHDIKLTVAAGSSGGAVCAAIVAVLANHKFTHVTAPASAMVSPDQPIANLLWNTWVDGFSFDQLTTDMSDLDGLIDEQDGKPEGNKQHVPSILNCRMLDDAAADIACSANQPPDTERRWIAKPLRVGITVANLSGVPYCFEAIHPVRGYAGAAYVQHDDFAWFAVPTWLTLPAPLPPGRPDEFWVGAPTVGYATMGHWATASGAMPIGMKARRLSRPLEHYLYRPHVRVTQNEAGRADVSVDWPLPDWKEIAGTAEADDYVFSAVDGGTFNDNPVRLVHDAMAGLIGCNPRDPELANRAMFMIDPLVVQPTRIKRIGLSLVAVAEAMVGVFVEAVHYLTADMDLFARQDVFSRFQLVPSRSVEGSLRVGQEALAGSGLLAMGGWCSRQFRIHDFMLGRANMKQYLTRNFILRADNPLFDRWHTSDQGRQLRQKVAMREDGTPLPITDTTPRQDYYLPIIPIADEVRADEPDWPVNAVDLDTVEAQLKGRLKAVLSVLRRDNLGGPLPWLFGLIVIPIVAGKIAKLVIGNFRQVLKRQKLLTSAEAR